MPNGKNLKYIAPWLGQVISTSEVFVIYSLDYFLQMDIAQFQSQTFGEKKASGEAVSILPSLLTVKRELELSVSSQLSVL